MNEVNDLNDIIEFMNSKSTSSITTIDRLSFNFRLRQRDEIFNREIEALLTLRASRRESCE